jgi:hypothetical protein
MHCSSMKLTVNMSLTLHILTVGIAIRVIALPIPYVSGLTSFQNIHSLKAVPGRQHGAIAHTGYNRA